MAFAGKRDPNFRLVGKVPLTAKASFGGCSHVHKSLPSSCRICMNPIPYRIKIVFYCQHPERERERENADTKVSRAAEQTHDVCGAADCL
jgi:hypothetical protein